MRVFLCRRQKLEKPENEYTSFFKNYLSTITTNGYAATQEFEHELFELLEKNTEQGTLPFFNKDLKHIPRELSTGKVIDDKNKAMLEMVASAYGYKSSLWIYGSELEDLQKKLGKALNYKKETKPALCIFDHATQGKSDERLSIAEGGTGSNAQYLYNFDSLTEHSQKIILEHYCKQRNIKCQSVSELEDSLDKNYQDRNRENFLENMKNRKTDKERQKYVKSALDIVNGKDSVGDLNIKEILKSDYAAAIIRQTGMKDEIDRGDEKEVYRQCKCLIDKVREEKLKTYSVGKSLKFSLDASTTMSRVYVAEGCNLENIRKRQEEQEKKTQIKSINRKLERNSVYDR